MSDIARAAGVSKNTVSLALRNDPQISAPMRARIHTLAEEMGYSKNPTVAHLMVQLRTQRSAGHQATLALLNANEDRQAFRRHPTIPTYVAGCRQRAQQLGYSLDEFWLHDSNLDGPKLNRILRARKIRGVIIVGLMRENHLPERFLRTWQEVSVRRHWSSHARTGTFICLHRPSHAYFARGRKCGPAWLSTSWAGSRRGH